MSYEGKRLPQPTFLSFPHHHKCLWCHEQLFVQHMAKSVTNPKTLRAFLALSAREHKQILNHTPAAQRRQRQGTARYKNETFSVGRRIILELFNLLVKSHAKSVPWALNLYFAPSHLFLPKHHSFLYANTNTCVTMELIITGNQSSGELNWQKQLVSQRFSHQAEGLQVPAKGREVCRLWQTGGCETSFTISLRLQWLWNYKLRFHSLGYVFLLVKVLIVFEISGQLQRELCPMSSNNRAF